MIAEQTLYSKARSNYEDARKALSAGDPVQILTLARQSLEGLVKAVAAECGLETNKGAVTLMDMINQMSETELIGKREAALLHRIRVLGNKGVHQSDEPPTMEEAEEAVEKLGTALELLGHKASDAAVVASVRDKSNVPMENPDYYGRNRRYFGAWDATSDERQLRTNTDYTKLEKLADKGDVQAMLDLASGFLRREMKFTGNGLSAGVSKRYYDWIMRACDTACEAASEGRFFAKKYIATALLEGAKYRIFRGIDGDFPRAIEYLKLLISLKRQYSGDIISPVHNEQSLKSIQYLLYFAYYMYPLQQFFVVESSWNGNGTQSPSVFKIRAAMHLDSGDRGGCDVSFKVKDHWFFYTDEAYRDSVTKESWLGFKDGRFGLFNLYIDPEKGCPAPYFITSFEAIDPADAGRIVMPSMLRAHREEPDCKAVYSQLSGRVAFYEAVVLAGFYSSKETRRAFTSYWEKYCENQKIKIQYPTYEGCRIALVDPEQEYVRKEEKNTEIVKNRAKPAKEAKPATTKDFIFLIAVILLMGGVVVWNLFSGPNKFVGFFFQIGCVIGIVSLICEIWKTVRAKKILASESTVRIMNSSCATIEKQFLSGIASGSISAGDSTLAETAARILHDYANQNKEFP